MGLIVQSWVQNGWARWASRLAIFAIQLAFVTFVMHRTHIIGTPLGLGLLAVSGGLAVLGGLLALIAFTRLWHYGGRGGLRSGFAVFVALLTLAGPLAYLPKAMSLPRINDVSTDLTRPPRIVPMAEAGPYGEFLAASRDGPDAEAQSAGYPDIRPIVVERTVAAAFDTARAIAEKEGLDVVLEDPPKQGRPFGVIQAVDETLVMGFRDDVVIRVSKLGRQARIDLRSASRYGQHDFGRNAARIREISRRLRARLDFVLPARLEDDDQKKRKVDQAKPAKTKKKKKRVRRKKRRPSSPKVRRAPKRIVPQQG